MCSTSCAAASTLPCWASGTRRIDELTGIDLGRSRPASARDARNGIRGRCGATRRPDVADRRRTACCVPVGVDGAARSSPATLVDTDAAIVGDGRRPSRRRVGATTSSRPRRVRLERRAPGFRRHALDRHGRAPAHAHRARAARRLHVPARPPLPSHGGNAEAIGRAVGATAAGGAAQHRPTGTPLRPSGCPRRVDGDVAPFSRSPLARSPCRPARARCDS